MICIEPLINISIDTVLCLDEVINNNQNQLLYIIILLNPIQASQAWHGKWGNLYRLTCLPPIFYGNNSFLLFPPKHFLSFSYWAQQEKGEPISFNILSPQFFIVTFPFLLFPPSVPNSFPTFHSHND